MFSDVSPCYKNIQENLIFIKENMRRGNGFSVGACFLLFPLPPCFDIPNLHGVFFHKKDPVGYHVHFSNGRGGDGESPPELSYKVFTRSHPENRFTINTFSFFREADFLPFDAGFVNSTLVPEAEL